MNKTEQGYVYQARCLLNRLNLDSAHDVTQEHVDHFRATCSLSPVSIEAAIKAVGIITGKKFTGKKLRKPQHRPKLVSLDDLSRVHGEAKKRQNGWMCRFLKYGFITGFRLGDLTRLPRSAIHDDAIEMQASKTGKLHIIPRHPILRHRLPADELPLMKCAKTVRAKLRYYCDLAGVPYFSPQMIRRSAANAYEKAHPGAGGVLLGHSLGSVTYSYYLDQFEVLKVAQEKLQIPQSMLPKGERWKRQAAEKDLQNAYRRLSESDRETVLRMVRRLA